MEGSMIDLSKYRFDNALDDIDMLQPYLESGWK